MPSGRGGGWGGSGGVAIVGMADWDKRKRSTWEVMDEISGKMQEVTDVDLGILFLF